MGLRTILWANNQLSQLVELKGKGVYNDKDVTRVDKEVCHKANHPADGKREGEETPTQHPHHPPTPTPPPPLSDPCSP